ncbi:uncharacterized protein At5g41620-like isoform X2 [Malania oleifera]|uniref:uncharacterized protein At5g41620-like isoform X2 n=1 Tax=Malania oleifera TaxID=397392 RepID=UPI0025AE1156|nr:uncharacterized protein At5g41620-like isoform X2 [Malania oleifera]
MEREEKGKEREAEKQGVMGKKLKRGGLVGKRGGPCTPSPTWRIGFSGDNDDDDGRVNSIKQPGFRATVSARKLGANLWEIQPHLPLSKMSKGLPHRRRRHRFKDQSFELPTTHLPHDPPHSPTAQPESASSLRRHVVASLLQHHQPIERNGRALEPVSPASYSSSMEVAPYNPVVPPLSSLNLKDRIGESSYNLKTSTELLKVLNHIWSLEEQHASNIAMGKALKMELDHSRVRIKELLQEKRRDQQEMDDLIKKIAEDKLVRKSKEQDRIKAAVQSVRDELDDERRLRKHSESLHRKLARELSEVKSSFSIALKEFERERRARILLEDLCDEFAKGIRDYEQKVRSLKHKPEKDRAGKENPDRLVLHISEAWLDERMQMKLTEARSDTAEKKSIVDKLSFEIETFLRAKESVGPREDTKSTKSSLNELKESCLRRHSLESFHLKEAVSAPKNVDDEDSTGSDLHGFELPNRAVGKLSNGNCKQHDKNALKGPLEEVRKLDPKKQIGSLEIVQVHNLPSQQMQFEEHMSGAMPSIEKMTQLAGTEQREIGGDSSVQIKNGQNFEITGATQEGSLERTNKQVETRGLNLNHRLENLVRNHSSSLQGEKLRSANNCRGDSHDQSLFVGHTSPVQQWRSRFTSLDPEVSESSTKRPQSLKENTLKAKLLEARVAKEQYTKFKPGYEWLKSCREMEVAQI